MDVQRYNQGFGFFGPLEKCDTGKLAYYDDMAAERHSLLATAHNASFERAKAQSALENALVVNLKRTEELERLQKLNTELDQSRTAAENNWIDSRARVRDLDTAFAKCQTVNKILFGSCVLELVGIALLVTKLAGNL